MLQSAIIKDAFGKIGSITNYRQVNTIYELGPVGRTVNSATCSLIGPRRFWRMKGPTAGLIL